MRISTTAGGPSLTVVQPRFLRHAEGITGQGDLVMDPPVFRKELQGGFQALTGLLVTLQLVETGTQVERDPCQAGIQLPGQTETQTGFFVDTVLHQTEGGVIVSTRE